MLLAEELYRRPQKTSAGAKKHEMLLKWEKAVLGSEWQQSLQIPPEGSSHTFHLHLRVSTTWMARGQRLGECPGPGCSGLTWELSALESSRCLVNLRKPQQNAEQWSSQSWRSWRLSSRPPPFHLSPFLLKPVECCLIRIKGAWAAPGYN